MKNDELMYDINSYTDAELFEIMELVNPTDDELEEAIVSNISTSTGEVKRFFQTVYAHFFDLESDVTTDTNGENNIEIRKRDGSLSTVASAELKAGQDGTVIDNKGAAVKGTTDIKEFTKEEQKKAEETEKTTHNVEYVKDNLNPIKRETMFKMISIDSQFRENARTTPSTNFALNLSTSIENVVSIKLYSINIPYAWYTINDGFGSNFFYIKGASPGINNGNHDIKIEVPSGNYNQKRLIERLNSDINNKKIIYTDTSLGATELIYDDDNAKVRIYIDVRKTFTEAEYTLFFPDWTSPNIEGQKGASIASFLGYNYATYYPLLVIGDFKSINNNSLPGAIINIQYVYKSGINDKFRVVQYTGTNAFNESAVIQSIDISLVGFSDGNRYSRTQLADGVRQALAASPYLDASFTDISLVRVDAGENFEWAGHSHYEMGIKLNRFTTQNIVNAKVAVIFPDESEILDDTTRIWTGNNSCFLFPALVNTLSEITSETATTVTNYVIGANKNKIVFSCINPAFSVLQNTYTAVLEASTGTGYTLSQLKTKINEALITMNDATKVQNLENGVFNITANNPSTFFDISGDKAFFQLNVTKTFDQTSYIIDLSNCFLSKAPFSFPNIVDDLSSNYYILETNFSNISQVVIAPGEYIKYSPKTQILYGNQNQDVLYVMLNSTGSPIIFANFPDLAAYINYIFDTVVDPETRKNILQYSELSAIIDQVFRLNLRIQKSLATNDYRVTFESTDTTNPWTTLALDTSYNLVFDTLELEAANISSIYGSNKVYANIMTVKAGKNQVIFKPYYDGVADVDGLNDIVFTVPVDNTGTKDYSRAGLVDTLQTLFDANPLTRGSTIVVGQTASNAEYTTIKMHIKKQYQPTDYKLVFYDGVSFRYCSTGNSGGNSIRTATWEATLGWLLGFHTFTEYALQDFTQITAQSVDTENYVSNLYSGIDTHGIFLYSYNATNGQLCVQSDSIFNTYIYSYFMIVLDDFIQNHVNDGLVTITSLESDISLPTYASRVSYQCDPVTGKKVAVSASNKERLNLNSKQLYAMNQIIEARRTKNRSYTPGPVLKDIFAIIPLKLSGLQFGAPYMEFGGSLQNQDRKYFGPVRLQKLAVKLMNDKGDVVNLNGTNWSFTIICEILVKNK